MIDFKVFYSQSSEFRNFNGVFGGGLSLENDRAIIGKATIKSVIFDRNRALLGGGAYI